ncbi:MAG: hypothetical protein MUC49_00755 [Raineya sp.]|jgi:hypothetical protein|nr:hypothetical protein [Raineya sp.]
MKKNVLVSFIALFLLVYQVSAQTLYEPFNKYNTPIKNYEYKSEKLLSDAKKRIKIESDFYAYQHENGYVSIGDHDRASVVIYDANGNWVETQIYSYYLHLSPKEINKFKEKIAKALQGSVYKSDMDAQNFYFTKTTNQKGSWYEINANSLEDTEKWGTAIISDKYKFIKFIPR